ncbi:MAG: hypothetical protein V7756_01230 [Halopseudomonas sp.]|uniref:esterase/lipase family protein n=1 Tax=Halopseudomonas sp. TaxID=2901191 RepID=UPI003002206C
MPKNPPPEQRRHGGLRRRWLIALAVVLGPASAVQSQPSPPPVNECVILLHGLARTSASMESLQQALSAAGYQVVNHNYPSRQHPVAELGKLAIGPALQACASESRVHFVTHSLGGIVLRYYLQQEPLPQLGRVVMLGPPNQGSEVVDELRELPGFAWINGPAGLQLGTGADELPRQLAKPEFSLGIIAGTRSINLLLSTLLPNPDDGKVSVASTRVDGMTDHISLPVTHPLMMRDEEVIAQTLHFLAAGRFTHPPSARPR